MDADIQKRRFPWLKAALAVSVLLNLAALGVLGGLLTRADGEGSFLRAAISALPEADRRDLRSETRAIWREARMQRDRSARPAGMIAALRADAFDPDAFARTLQQSQDRVQRISAQMHAQIVARIAAMTPEQRRAYADALEARLDTRRGEMRDRSGPRPQR